MPGRIPAGRRSALSIVASLAIVLSGCTAATSTRPSPSPSDRPSVSASATPSASPSDSPNASPSATPAGIDPQFVPTLAAIQMVRPRLGWTVGSYAIFNTIDGAHWAKQYASTEEFVGVDFVSATTGWVVGIRTLLGTTDGGHSWRPLGEAQKPLRSVHFISPLEGWGIAGGADPQMNHGWLVPSSAGTLVTSEDGGRTWSNLDSPADPQSVCFSERSHGWLATGSGSIYASPDGGQTWAKAFDTYQAGTGVGHDTIIECAAPSSLWVLTTIENAAAGHVPYVAYATQDGRSWRTVLAEPYTTGNQLPGVPAGPDAHPGSLSVVDPTDAVFVGDGPATDVAQCVIASGGGATVRRTGHVDNSAETFGAAFISTTTGWVLTRNAGGDYVIDLTTDGGWHWAQQFAVPPSSAG